VEEEAFWIKKTALLKTTAWFSVQPEFITDYPKKNSVN